MGIQTMSFPGLEFESLRLSNSSQAEALEMNREELIKRTFLKSMSAEDRRSGTLSEAE